MCWQLAHLRVAGVSFRQGDVRACQVNDVVEFKNDPTNEYDQHAVKVFVTGANGTKRWVGYVPKDCTLNLKRAVQREDYSGCRIVMIGIPPDIAEEGRSIVGIRLGLYFKEDPPRMYPNTYDYDDELRPY